MRNIADGVSLAQTAQGALQGMTENVQRIRELSVQAANGTLDDTQRNHLQAEVTILRQQASDALLETRFNGKQLFGHQTPPPPPLSGYYWNDASVSIQVSPSAGDVISTTVSAWFFPNFDVTTQASADVAISSSDQSLKNLSEVAAQFGAFQNRLAAAAQLATTSQTNLLDARSRILDADYASETTQLAKQEILANASAAMLSMANAEANSVLSLLRT